MKRIKVAKKELIAELIEQVIDGPDEEVVLVVPKGSNIGESVSNFHLLDREARAAGKKISIESVDESVLALARSSQIEAHHPLLESRHVSGLSDIIPKTHTVRPPVGETEETREVKNEMVLDEPTRFFPEEREVATPLLELEANPHRFKFRMRFNPKTLLWLVVIAGVIFGTVFVVDRFWSRATIEVTLAKTSWAYDHVFVADVSVSKPDSEKNILPAELFTLQTNGVQLFSASGKKNVAQKSAGKIIIYNAYSSKPQTLVASTRFETPDGKIFRISGQVVVPAASIKDGKIIPSKIDADIVADKSGPAYNVGPVSKLTIPGFKGSPRYDGFYGEIIEPTKGGFEGERAVPTADDIAKAKASSTKVLNDSLKTKFLSAYPADFKIPDGASRVTVTKLNVNENTDDNGKFSVFGEATMKAIGFKEGDLMSLLLKTAAAGNPKLIFKDKELVLTYKDTSPDFVNKKMTFDLSASGTLWSDFKAKDFVASVLGKQVSEARTLTASIDGLSTGKISIWPVWVGTVPVDVNRVKVSVY